jgi:hypothetical protein
MAEVRSTIVCPACGHRESEIIPEDACQYFYKCNANKGDCCVFCSYGDVKCPSAQGNAGCCRARRSMQWVHGSSSEISALAMARLIEQHQVLPVCLHNGRYKRTINCR